VAVLPNVRSCANLNEDVSLQKLFTVCEHTRLLFSADAQMFSIGINGSV
jgi:hypothetical protein